MRTNEELEAELEELKKEFYFFSKSGNSGGSQGGKPGGSQGGGSSPSTDDGEWIVLYDMFSEDPELNRGKPTGIHGEDGYIDGFPNMLDFNKVRLTFTASAATNAYEFNIYHDRDFNGMRILQHNGIGSHIFATATSIDVYDGIGYLDFGTIREITLLNNKYPSLSYTKNEFIRYEKVEVKK